MATIYNMADYREPKPDPVDDTVTNELWDKFLDVSVRAAEWRDRETLEELKEIITQLEPALELPLASLPGANS